MKKIILLLLIILAGCTQSKQAVSGGLIISNFVVDPQTVESGENFRIYMEIENIGERTAENIAGKIYGIEGINSLKTVSIPPVTDNSPGGFTTFTWDSIAPDLPQGTSKKYTITGRLEYDYYTSAVANILAISKDEEIRRKKMGLSSGNLEISNTEGPIKVSISGDYPIVVRDGNGVDIAVYKITFENVGTGVPITNDVVGLVTGNITVADRASYLECLGQQSNVINLPKDSEYSVLLRYGDRASITCSLIVNRKLWLYQNTPDKKPQGTIPIIFNLNYRYYVEDKAELTVVQRKR